MLVRDEVHLVHHHRAEPPQLPALQKPVHQGVGALDRADRHVHRLGQGGVQRVGVEALDAQLQRRPRPPQVAGLLLRQRDEGHHQQRRARLHAVRQGAQHQQLRHHRLPTASRGGVHQVRPIAQHGPAASLQALHLPGEELADAQLLLVRAHHLLRQPPPRIPQPPALLVLPLPIRHPAHTLCHRRCCRRRARLRRQAGRADPLPLLRERLALLHQRPVRLAPGMSIGPHVRLSVQGEVRHPPSAPTAAGATAASATTTTAATAPAPDAQAGLGHGRPAAATAATAASSSAATARTPVARAGRYR